jgi:5S rRNA maturation endonuclease (ribonuclease M5)
LLFQVVRFEPKDFRQRRPNGNGGWAWRLGKTRRVIYRLPRVLAAVEAGETVWVAEGERDVESLERVGVVATCNPMGALKWRKEYAESLRGAKVVVVQDKDDAGRRHAQEVVKSLLGVATEVKLVEGAEGKDAAEHLGAGRTIEELVPVFLPRPSRNGPNAPNDRPDSAPRAGSSVRSETERSTERPPNDLAKDPQILDRHDELMEAQGLVGERHISRATYLVHVSRLLREPAREVVKGDSSTGKSFAVECALAAAAPEYLYVRSQTSPLALFYSEEDFRHKTIVFFEANKLGDDDDELARMLRTLISEGKLAYEVTAPEKRSTVYLEKEGPVAFISTTCKASLDKEIETRILSLHSDNTDEQTKAVVSSILRAAIDTPLEPELADWHELDRWLAVGPREVVLPWAAAVAEFELSGPPRLRRDVSNLLALSRAHALLSRANRKIDPRERIVSTLEDYDVVRRLLADSLAVATDRAGRPGTRAIVEAVGRLRERGKKTVSASAASREAGRSKSTTHTDVHDALAGGYLIDRSPVESRFDLEVGDSLPDQDDLLPKTVDVGRVYDRLRSVTVRSTVRPWTERANPLPERDCEDRSVRSVDSEGGVEETLGEAWDRLERQRREGS